MAEGLKPIRTNIQGQVNTGQVEKQTFSCRFMLVEKFKNQS